MINDKRAETLAEILALLDLMGKFGGFILKSKTLSIIGDFIEQTINFKDALQSTMNINDTNGYFAEIQKHAERISFFEKIERSTKYTENQDTRNKNTRPYINDLHAIIQKSFNDIEIEVKEKCYGFINRIKSHTYADLQKLCMHIGVLSESFKNVFQKQGNMTDFIHSANDFQSHISIMIILLNNE